MGTNAAGRSASRMRRTLAALPAPGSIRLYPEFATHDDYLWSDYIVISGTFILYEISMECAQEYPHPQRSSKS
ncbi:MAG: hypothetical protein ABF297_17385, partial [Thiogranum sp.]